MAIEWTEDLATGVSRIDAQHQELFRRINSLLEACNKGKGKEEVIPVVKFLEDYVVTHFAEEEKQMIHFNYPEYEHHKAEHLKFMENFSKVKDHLKADSIGLTAVIMTNQLVIDWLRSHIRRIDRELGSFLKTKPLA
ncbi:MAG: hemerythrin family protein [Nitrospirae bacterium]|nr:hemerythrin family protein [Nitrospirota bacterium]